jgi:hypothetical protein
MVDPGSGTAALAAARAPAVVRRAAFVYWATVGGIVVLPAVARLTSQADGQARSDPLVIAAIVGVVAAVPALVVALWIPRASRAGVRCSVAKRRGAGAGDDWRIALVVGLRQALIAIVVIALQAALLVASVIAVFLFVLGRDIFQHGIPRWC